MNHFLSYSYAAEQPLMCVKCKTHSEVPLYITAHTSQLLVLEIFPL